MTLNAVIQAVPAIVSCAFQPQICAYSALYSTMYSTIPHFLDLTQSTNPENCLNHDQTTKHTVRALIKDTFPQFFQYSSDTKNALLGGATVGLLGLHKLLQSPMLASYPVVMKVANFGVGAIGGFWLADQIAPLLNQGICWATDGYEKQRVLRIEKFQSFLTGEINRNQYRKDFANYLERFQRKFGFPPSKLPTHLTPQQLDDTIAFHNAASLQLHIASVTQFLEEVKKYDVNDSKTKDLFDLFKKKFGFLPQDIPSDSKSELTQDCLLFLDSGGTATYTDMKQEVQASIAQLKRGLEISSKAKKELADLENEIKEQFRQLEEQDNGFI